MVNAKMWFDSSGDFVITPPPDKPGGKNRPPGQDKDKGDKGGRGGGWTGRGGGGGPRGKPGGGGGGGSSDLAPDFLKLTPTSGATAEFLLDHENRFRHVLIMDDITSQVSGSGDQYVIEFRRASDSVWEQGASAYQWMLLGTSNDSNSTLDVNIPLANCGNTISNLVCHISGAGLAVPTRMFSRMWISNTQHLKDGMVTDTNIHDMVRVRCEGTHTFVGGTIYLARME